MPNVDISKVVEGNTYTANDLASLWNYESYHGLAKGIVTIANDNKILLFVTRIKRKGAKPYVDEIKSGILYMQGQEKHGTDQRLSNNIDHKLQDEFYLFYRDRYDLPFTYMGRSYIINAKINKNEPSEFEFLIVNSSDHFDDTEDIIDYFVNISDTREEITTLLVEGAKKISTHVRYERNPQNRKKAIRMQGHICKICGFDFNKVYGNNIAEDYIEVHHIKAISEGEQLIDPSKDLIPICANCHRMLHRKKKEAVTVNMLSQKDSVLNYAQCISKMLLEE